MRFVVANFWPQFRYPQRRVRRAVHNPGTHAAKSAKQFVITPIPVDGENYTLPFQGHLTANDPLTPRKRA